MRCRLKKLTPALLSLSLSACAHKQVPVDSYCLRYNEVVRAKGDGAIKAKPEVKQRILANELNYEECKKEAGQSTAPTVDRP